MKELKIVLHVDEPGRWMAALSNLRNLTRDYPAARVRVVVNGEGIYAFQGTNDLTRRMAGAAGHGVEFQVCENSLRSHRVDAATLPEYVKPVPAGVVALAEAQADGFAYIKP